MQARVKTYTDSGGKQGPEGLEVCQDDQSCAGSSSDFLPSFSITVDIQYYFTVASHVQPSG